MKFLRATLIAAVAIVMSVPASAQTSTRYRAVYYSNAQMNEEVGYVIVTCDNQAYGNGYLTQWYEETWWDC